MFREGLQIGSYKLIKRLGRGGFGQVWLAEKESQFLTKKVAVKFPHIALLDYDTIKHEAMLWEQASGHPNVLPIIDADIFDDQVVIVSEYAEGGSLAERIETKGKLTVKQSVEMTIGILHGLEFLHSKNIIHRDIKPQNILLQGDTPRLSDFGISRFVGNISVDSIPVGTAAYMSPEAFDGRRNVLTDIWSVGVVLYELLKGGLPFPQDNFHDRMMAILSKEIEPLSIEVPYKLREIVRKALTKNPSERFESAKAMRDDLQIVWAELSQMHNAKTEVFQVPIDYGQTTPPVYFKPLADLTTNDAELSQVTIQIPKFHPTAPQQSFQTAELPKPKGSPLFNGALIAILAFAVLAAGAGIVWMNSGKKTTSEILTEKPADNSNTSATGDSTSASLSSNANSNSAEVNPVTNKLRANKPLTNANTTRVNRVRETVRTEDFEDEDETSDSPVNTSRIVNKIKTVTRTSNSNVSSEGVGGDGSRNRNQ